MTQLHLFQERNRIFKKMEPVHSEFLDVARTVARYLCRLNGQVSASDVHEVLDRNGIKPLHPNAWGPVFNKDFVPCGWTVSKSKSRRGGMQRVWRLR